MIVLDDHYTSALLRQALDDGFVEFPFSGSPYKDPYLKNLLTRGLNKQLREEALWNLLLFGTAILAPFDNLRADKLISEGLMHKDSASNYIYEESQKVDENPEIIRELQELLIGDLKNQGYQKSSVKHIDEYIQIEKDDLLGHYSKLKAATYGFEDYEQYKSFAQKLEEKDYSLPTRGRRPIRLRNTPMPGIKQTLLGEVTEEKFRFIKENEQKIEMFQSLHNRAAFWRSLIRIASEHDATIKARTFSTKKFSGKTSDVATTNPKYVYATIKVWLQEITYRPRPDRIDDVLRLRENKFFSEFNKLILSWAEKLATGNEDDEKALRTEIKNANKHLSSLSKFQEAARWITYISLPIDAAMLFLGASIPTSPIGFGIQLYADIAKRPYRWILFGTE